MMAVRSAAGSGSGAATTKPFRVLPHPPAPASSASSNHQQSSSSSSSSAFYSHHSRSSSTFAASKADPLDPPLARRPDHSLPLPRPPANTSVDALVAMPGLATASSSGSIAGSGLASRSRSGSVAARHLSVNTSAASPSAVPALPSMSASSVDSSAMSAAPVASPISNMSSPPYPQSASQSPALGGSQRERSLTHKSSSRTIGSASVMSATTAVIDGGSGRSGAGRKSSTASSSTTNRQAKDASRTRERDRERDRDREGRDRDGREKAPAERERKAERQASGGSAIGVGELDEDVQRIPHHDAEPAPPTLMYWSRAPIWGSHPTHKMRSHSATVVDNTTIWMFGGCDDKEFWRDVLCLDVETMEWTRPETIGDVPPPCRAHTATLVDRRLFVFGGGQGNMYYNALYILDTVSRRWTHITSSHKAQSIATGADSPASDSDAPSAGSTTNGSASDDSLPRPRRAHTTVLYKTKLVVFGGGNGAMALNDVWIMDVSVPPDRMRWTKQRTTGAKPTPRGYHTSNLVGNVMVVVGGSDGRQTFSDIFCLNLDTWHWSSVHADRAYRRLAHTATQIGSYLFIMGGHDGTQYTNELLLFNLVSLQYEPRQIRGVLPSARGYHAAALSDGRLWLFGGYDGRSAHDDVHMLDLASSAYLSQVTGFQINVD